MMNKRELIEQKAGLIAACKIDYNGLVKELSELVSSIDSLPNDEAPRVIELGSEN